MDLAVPRSTVIHSAGRVVPDFHKVFKLPSTALDPDPPVLLEETVTALRKARFGTAVAVGVRVAVAVFVAVGVLVGVGVFVAVGVFVTVGEFVGVGVSPGVLV